jgi:hypothetical protein
MAQFIETTQLPSVLRDLIREAKRELFLVSPFFKLEGEYIKMLETVSREKPKLQIKVLFGKNETNKQRSLSDSDLAIMKGWTNVDIRYADNLHAKFYGNESKALVTSLNFHAFSLGNNIESGVLLEKSLAEMVTKNKPFEEAYKYFQATFEVSEQVFSKSTKKASLLSFGLKSDSVNIADNTSQVFSKREKAASSSKSSFWDKKIEPIGYCIRTGVKIPFNPEMPYCEKAYASWSRYQDPTYPEKFCHYSGEEGETSMEKPILRKNWATAKKLIQ